MSVSRKLIEVRPSDIHGQGLFAVESIPGNTLVLVYDGYVVRDIEATALDCFMVDGKVERTTNEMRWLNHSDTPNAIFVGVDIYAQRDIGAGEEVTVSYTNLSRLTNNA